MFSRKAQGIVICAFTCLLLSGCGRYAGTVAAVSGKVTKDGQPLPNVQVAFAPIDGGRTSTAMTNESGEYQLIYTNEVLGAEVGNHKVTVATGGKSNFEITNDANEKKKERAEKFAILLTKVVEVNGGGNTLNLEVTGKPIDPNDLSKQRKKDLERERRK